MPQHASRVLSTDNLPGHLALARMMEETLRAKLAKVSNDRGDAHARIIKGILERQLRALLQDLKSCGLDEHKAGLRAWFEKLDEPQFGLYQYTRPERQVVCIQDVKPEEDARALKGHARRQAIRNSEWAARMRAKYPDWERRA